MKERFVEMKESSDGQTVAQEQRVQRFVVKTWSQPQDVCGAEMMFLQKVKSQKPEFKENCLLFMAETWNKKSLVQFIDRQR